MIQTRVKFSKKNVRFHEKPILPGTFSELSALSSVSCLAFKFSFFSRGVPLLTTSFLTLLLLGDGLLFEAFSSVADFSCFEVSFKTLLLASFRGLGLPFLLLGDA